MRLVLSLVLAALFAPVFLGCGGPERSTATEQEVMANTTDPSKLLTPAEVPDPAAGGGAATPTTPAAP
jgi:hypothetical protein